MSVLSAAVAMALCVFSLDASALTLGRLNVQSALGEPLRAEIDISDIAPGEGEGLNIRIASPEAFSAAGVPFNAVLSDLRVALQRRADGHYVVRLTSNRLISEPFVDLLLEANWNSGRIVRDYTVLLDPPGSRRASAPVVVTAPQTSAAPALRPTPAIVPQAPAVVPQAQAPRPRPTAAPSPVAPATAETPRPTGGDQQVTVRAGDTASKIAGAYKAADVSLDQMLVALLRANPNAFIGGNVNRIKAGAVLEVPGAAQAGAVPAPEARRTVTAQSRDFGDYRRRLADNAPTSRVADASRQASGKLDANVEDRNAANAAADKLRISQGGAARTREEALAKAGQAKESGTRVAELSKNISDLNKLQAASGAQPSTTGGSGSTAPTAPTAPLPAATAPAATATASPNAASATIDSAPAAASTLGAASPTVAASTAGASPQTTTPSATDPTAATPPPAAAASLAPAPATPAERGFIAELLDTPLMLGLAALVALLVAFLLYRVLGRKRQESGDSVFLESRIPKDSFFGASGGESVDTKDRGNSVVSSLSYSPSQLDAGDVDPVAEADVYLAYGRDLQAEEILREALRVSPERTAIHVKLLEIHAKRRDLRTFESLATDVHKLTGGTGPEWNRVVELGKELDPGNPLYDSGSRNNVTAAEAAAFAGSLAAATVASAAPAPNPVVEPLVAAPPPSFVPSVAPLDFDLDLSKPMPLQPVKPTQIEPILAPIAAAAAPELPELPIVAPRSEPEPLPHAPLIAASEADEPLSPTLRLDLDHDFDTAPGALDAPTERVPLSSDMDFSQPATLRAGLPGDSGFIEFDMSSLAGLSAHNPADTEPGRLEPLDEGGESPHAIKLSLARELKALGDVEGARSLVEEVEAESSGEVKAEAKQLLVQLS